MDKLHTASARPTRVAPRKALTVEFLSPAALDGLSLAIITDKKLRRIGESEKLDLQDIRGQIEKVLLHYRSELLRPSAQPIDLHRKVMDGFAGTAILISSALLLDTLGEAESFFHFTFKTLKSKIDQVLEPGPSELALRMVRATVAATHVFGNLESARTYLKTKNFALGGAAPIDLLHTAEGERIVLNELQTQADGGPV